RNIFFVQTKIDQYSKEDWQNIQSRNQEILKERFKGRLADTRVWPVSSTNLRKAASADGKAQEEAYLMVSRHKELTAAMQAFLARVSGWGRTTEAIAVAARYHDTSRKALAGRLAGLTAESEQKQAELQKVAVESKRRFDGEWGIQGQKYRELREGLQRATTIGKQSFSNTLQQGSDIELAQKAKIDAVKSLKQADRIAEEMPGELITATMNNWARICDEVQQRCVALLGPFAEAIEDIDTPVDPELSGFSDGDSKDKFKHDYFNMFRSAAGGGMMVMGVTGIGSMRLPAAAAAVFTTVMPFVAIPALAVLVGGGIKGARTSGVKTAQQQLKMQLAEQLQKVRRYFFDVHLTDGSYSRVDEYFTTLDRTVNEQVRQLVEKKSKESQAEINRIKEAIQLSDREREARIKQVQEQLAKWDEVGKSLGAVTAQVKALQRPAAPATV
ncbi:MAG TPA: hypothetical protein VFG99_06750, partial [Chloroflexia bacterium]|nr:hypothetical protein [Chloroflexia bacterium]